MFDLAMTDQLAKIKVIGVGGGGGNAVQHMVQSDIQGVKFVCANTDKQALDRMNAPFKIQLGEQSTRGLGAGANPAVKTISNQLAFQYRHGIWCYYRHAH